jgi:hypothetical protein
MARSIMAAAIAPLLVGNSALATQVPSGAVMSTSAAAANLIPRARLEPGAARPSYRDGGWRCPSGFVWRNAGRQDWLCVNPFEAQQVARENREAPNNWIDTPDGSHECRPGLVARDAVHHDNVCVDPVRRALVHEMSLALYNMH